jgi:hypothetical protein
MGQGLESFWIGELKVPQLFAAVLVQLCPTTTTRVGEEQTGSFTTTANLP